MWLMGVLELVSDWHFNAQHVRGGFNNVADGISRWALNDVHNNLVALRPDIPWQVKYLGEQGRILCTSVLA